MRANINFAIKMQARKYLLLFVLLLPLTDETQTCDDSPRGPLTFYNNNMIPWMFWSPGPCPSKITRKRKAKTVRIVISTSCETGVHFGKALTFQFYFGIP